MKPGFIFFIFVIFVVVGFLASASEGGDFETNVLILKASVQGRNSVDMPVFVVNNGDAEEFEVSVNSFYDFIEFEKEGFYLENLEEEIFEVRFDSEELDLGVYSGELIIETPRDKESIPVIFEVESERPNFDVSIDSSPGELERGQGNAFVFNVKLFNLRSEEGEAEVFFRVLDKSGVTILSSNQSVDVEDQVSVIKTIETAEVLTQGEYVFAVEIADRLTKGTSSVLFSVVEFEEKRGREFYFPLLVGVIVFLVLSFLVVNYYWNKRVKETAKTWNKKLVDIKNVRLGDISKEIHKLEYKKKVLEKAYNKGYIRRVNFEVARKELNKLIMKLKKRL